MHDHEQREIPRCELHIRDVKIKHLQKFNYLDSVIIFCVLHHFLSLSSFSSFAKTHPHVPPCIHTGSSGRWLTASYFLSCLVKVNFSKPSFLIVSKRFQLSLDDSEYVFFLLTFFFKTFHCLLDLSMKFQRIEKVKHKFEGIYKK